MHTFLNNNLQLLVKFNDRLSSQWWKSSVLASSSLVCSFGHACFSHVFVLSSGPQNVKNFGYVSGRTDLFQCFVLDRVIDNCITLRTKTCASGRALTNTSTTNIYIFVHLQFLEIICDDCPLILIYYVLIINEEYVTTRCTN